jgi:hypothetical protein
VYNIVIILTNNVSDVTDGELGTECSGYISGISDNHFLANPHTGLLSLHISL